MPTELEDEVSTLEQQFDEQESTPSTAKLPGATVQQTPGGDQPGPGFIELPPVGRDITKSEAIQMGIGNVRRQTESFRSLPVDIAIKGTLSSQLGRLVTTSKAARLFPPTSGLKVTRFAAANAAGDVLGEIALQGAEIALGQREKLSPLEIAISAGSSFGFSFAMPVIGRFIARIGKIAPRDFKELAFRGIVNQFKLILPKGIFDPVSGKMSAEMRLGKRFTLKTIGILRGEGNRAAREIAKELGESIGVTAEQFGLPSAARNANMLVKSSQAGNKISLRPLLDDSLEMITNRSIIGQEHAPFKQAANQVVRVLAKVEETYAKQGFMVSPTEFNQIVGDLEDAAIGTIVRMSGKGQQLASPLARETETKRIFFKMFLKADKLLRAEMDSFSSGAWSANRALTHKTLKNSERLAKKMTDEQVVNFVQKASENEGIMGLVRQFDQLNKTSFSKEIFELFLSRRLSGGATAQTEPIVGFARSIAPRLVMFTQFAKAWGIATRPISAVGGALASEGTRDAKAAKKLIEKKQQEFILALEEEFNRTSFPEAEKGESAASSKRIRISDRPQNIGRSPETI